VTYTRRSRIRKLRVAALLVVFAAIGAALGDQLPASSSSPSTAAPPPAIDVDVVPGEPRRARLAGVADLDADLRDALRHAASDAADDGVELRVDSGRRSPEYQQRLFDDAVAKYGSEAEAARWVATPNTSAHVSGDAVDIGPPTAAAWLSEHGTDYGLCQIYANEPWHYELRPEATDQGCPPTYADPTHDPRMQQ
jgi:hypothetical protein